MKTFTLKSQSLLLLFFIFNFHSSFGEKISSAPFVFEKPVLNNTIKYSEKNRDVKNIFIDAVNGNDNNNGQNPDTPIRSLSKLSITELSTGANILLKGNQTHKGTIELININTASNKNIYIGSYGEGKATIDFKGYPAGIWIENTSNVFISDLRLTGNGGPRELMIRPNEKYKDQRYGIRILSSQTKSKIATENIKIQNVDIYDVFLLNPVNKSRACRQWDMNDSAGWGWGIYGEVIKGKGINDVLVKEVNISNVSNIGIRFKGQGNIDGTKEKNVNDVKIESCTVYQSGGPGMQFSRTNHSSMRNCRITESGNSNDNRKWGRGSGMWTWGCNYFLLEHNIFEGAQGIADCCGAHIDFNCSNVVIQYCLSRYNCGGFIEVLGLNHNCSYRYNVSINDGWRNLKDKPAQDFWGKVGNPGCLVTINGHNNEKCYKGPYSTYIYNNTIICTEDGNKPYQNPFIFNIATSNRGVLVMNNIFWFAKRASSSWSMHKWKDGKPYDAAVDFRISYSQKENSTEPDSNGSYFANVRPMNEEELAEMEVVMKNNLYKLYNPEGTDKFSKVINALPDGYWDENALGGNPLFINENGLDAKDMIPQNETLINKGMEITKLKADKTSYGVYFGGLNVEKDFFGNKIKGNIIGAIAPQKK